MLTSRRSVLAGLTSGAAATLLPLASDSRAKDAVSSLLASGFTHGVASGEPGPHSILLWTRFRPETSQDSVLLQAELALEPEFSYIVAKGAVHTGAYRDWTAKVTVQGLQSGTVYWYRFIAPDGRKSLTGRTKSLPVGKVEYFGLATFSCANLNEGWLNAYAHAADRSEIDLCWHLGDYFYEYAPTTQERLIEPAHETVSLQDYRWRYASYRADPDLQRLHQMVPMICQYDDHEIANDIWEGGAQNHQSDREGDWSVRKQAAVQAYREWMPVSELPWQSYKLGTLATLYRTDSRLYRTRQSSLAGVFAAADPNAALHALAGRIHDDHAATMLGSEQEAWLAAGMGQNARQDGWQIIGSSCVMGQLNAVDEELAWLLPDVPASLRAYVEHTILAAKAGVPTGLDRWSGYPLARARLLRSAQDAQADLVILSGDSHNAWAFSLSEQGRPAGVEFSGQSVTSVGSESTTRADSTYLQRALQRSNPELVWANIQDRGYMMTHIHPDHIRNDWCLMPQAKVRYARSHGQHSLLVRRGRNFIE